ncbi:MAG: Mur ligase family protein [Actinomycetota bacterium]
MAWDGLARPWARQAAAELRELGVRVALGGEGTELLRGGTAPNCLVKSPGLPPTVPLLEEAARAGIEIVDEAELGWRLDTRPLVAVTGTNGKSTVAALVRAVLTESGARPCIAANTYFGPPLSALPEEPDVVVGEISSYQLDFCPALLPEAALLTNLTAHHLKRHDSVERYAECKRRLFVRGEAATGLAVLNLDDQFGRRLAAEVDERGGRVVGYGRGEDAEYRLQGIQWSLTEGRVRAATPSGELELRTRLPGPYNAQNVLAALALAGGLGIDLDEAALAIGQTEPVPGRLEVIRQAPPIDVIVDYAHDPVGTAAVLGIGREFVRRRGQGRLVAVLSSVDVISDQTEQRQIGMAAGRLCDLLVLTSSRWDLAEPASPPSPLVEGAQAAGSAAVETVDDRGEAIRGAIATAGDGDCVLILGRGPFGGRLYDSRGKALPFDDREVAHEAVLERE